MAAVTAGGAAGPVGDGVMAAGPAGAAGARGWAVELRLACKSFSGGGPPVLRDLNMRVPRGCIYGLLGASGCGKTTLLRSALGRAPLDAGDVTLLGHPLDPAHPAPKDLVARVGYMPQDAALLGDLTVRDALFYYGRLFAMDEAAIEARMDFLVPLLQLPPDNQPIKKLSGGQMRRVSLAATLIHGPELLVLDEPTVGLDPLLRDSIWNYLKMLTEGGKTTVIITTHYIEEAQNAHLVGIMRLGKLLAEDSPRTLTASHNCTTLEDVFLTLSHKQDKELQELVESSLEEAAKSIRPRKSITGSVEEFCMDSALKEKLVTVTNDRKRKQIASYSPEGLEGYRLKALLIKNFLIMKRNPTNIAGMIVIPFLQVTLFFLAIGGFPMGIKLAVVNDELNGSSNCATYTLENGITLYNSFTENCEFRGISCLYLNLINGSLIDLVYFSNKEEAVSKVREGKAIGVLHVSTNFSSQLQARFFEDGRKPTFQTIEDSEIRINMDMTEQQIASLIQGMLYENYRTLIDDLAEACGLKRKFLRVPVHFNQPLYGTEYPQYKVFMIPGVLTSIAYFLSISLTALVMVRERHEGIWSRDIVAGVTSLEILFSHFLCQSIWVFVQTFVTIMTAYFVYQMECKGSMVLLFFVIILQGLCGLTFGLVISVISSSISVAMFIAMGIYVPFINLSGGIWPIEGMPEWLQYISYSLPTTLPTITVSSILQRGWSITHPRVLAGVGIMLIWIFLHLLYSVVMLRWMYKKGNKI